MRQPLKATNMKGKVESGKWKEEEEGAAGGQSEIRCSPRCFPSTDLAISRYNTCGVKVKVCRRMNGLATLQGTYTSTSVCLVVLRVVPSFGCVWFFAVVQPILLCTALVACDVLQLLLVVVLVLGRPYSILAR